MTYFVIYALRPRIENTYLTVFIPINMVVLSGIYFAKHMLMVGNSMMEGVSMKKLAAILVSFFVIAGCAHITAKDCAKYTLQATVGVAVMAATGVDVTDFDPWSTSFIASELASSATGYVFDEITEPDSYNNQTVIVDEVEYLPEDSLAYIEYPPYNWAENVGYKPYY